MSTSRPLESVAAHPGLSQGIPQHRIGPWRLLGRVLAACCIAFSVAHYVEDGGSLLGTDDGRFLSHTDIYRFRVLPADDKRLLNWAHSPAGTTDATVSRTRSVVVIRYVRSSSKPALDPPWAELGYTPPVKSDWQESPTEKRPADPARDPVRAGLAMDLGLLVAAGYLSMTRLGSNSPSRRWFGTPPWKAVRYGLVAGIGILLIGLLIAVPVVLLTGHSASARDVLIQGMFNNGRPTAGALAFICVVAPICEEAFCRGAVLGAFDDAGYPWWGLFTSAAVFAIAHGDPKVLPGTFVFGLAMAWLNRRTGSLLAPITAHVLNNSVAAAAILVLMHK